MNSVRVTKYNPLNRDKDGLYTLRDEWTSISDVGNSYYSKIFTMEEYLAIEEKYINAVEVLVQETGITNLKIIGLENHFKEKNLNLSEGKTIPRSLIKDLVRMILREQVWGKLVAKNQFEVHFGYDYYMYFVGESITEDLIDKLKKIEGLYVEDILSPYLEY